MRLPNDKVYITWEQLEEVISDPETSTFEKLQMIEKISLKNSCYWETSNG